VCFDHRAVYLSEPRSRCQSNDLLRDPSLVKFRVTRLDVEMVLVLVLSFSVLFRVEPPGCPRGSPTDPDERN